MKTYSREEVSRLTGIPLGTLGSLYQMGVIQASGRLTIGEVLALAVSRGLKTRGVPWEEAGNALAYLWEMPQERLEANFARGACFLLVIGTKVLPRLLTLNSINSPTGVDPAEVAKHGLLPFAVDVKTCWDRIAREAGIESRKVEEVESVG